MRISSFTDVGSVLLRGIRRIPSGIDKLRRNGVIQCFRLLFLYVVLPGIMPAINTILAPVWLKFYNRLTDMRRRLTASNHLRKWQCKQKELLEVGKRGYHVSIERLGLTAENLERVKDALQFSDEIPLAEIDQDGFLLSYFGPIGNAPTIGSSQFRPRKRFIVTVVAVRGLLAVKKDYRGDTVSFLKEVEALHSLGQAGCHVPAILDIDFPNRTLTFSYIGGAVLREELAKRGAMLRDRDVEAFPEFRRLRPKHKWLRRVQEGRRFLHDVVSPQFIEAVFHELQEIHASGFILYDFKYGNIIIEERSGAPFFTDFDCARRYKHIPRTFLRVLRDHDIELFNLHFGTQKATYKRVSAKIRTKNIPGFRLWYAPVYLGAGLRFGRLWDVAVGYGRWHYILKRNLPPLNGKRILDLGANNAFNSIQMLRHGAREAIGIELDQGRIAQAAFVKEVFEWADNTRYNLRCIRANMGELPSMELGSFDLVIALCSIYYLDDHTIASLIRHIGTISDLVILQCNVAIEIGRGDAHAYEKASVHYAVNALESNGFRVKRVVAPRGYSRPLVIARRQQ